MINHSRKCSSKKHNEVDAICYCQECKLYFCNKCESIHSELIDNHHLYKLDKNENELFTGFCQEENHFDKLEVFCKTHNQLCCVACISKITIKGKGQHSNCDICVIEEIKEQKKTKLKENIQYLENISKTFEQSINELKNIFEKINKNKEDLKIQIQKLFTKIRNKINEREDELLSEVDTQFESLYFKEDIIKESEKLPNKIKLSLEKGKINDDEWKDDNKLSSLINICINIEKKIKEIDIINKKIKNSNTSNLIIKFNSNDYKENKLINSINKFGDVYFTNKFQFKLPPKNNNNIRKYSISGETDNIATKNEDNLVLKMYGLTRTTILSKNILQNYGEYRWKIKILKSRNNNIIIGVSPIDCNSSFNESGWHIDCSNSELYSGPPHNYNGKKSNLKKVIDEIIVVMNMNKGTLKFIINNEDKGESYTNIPLDKPLTPSVCLINQNDSVEISQC